MFDGIPKAILYLIEKRQACLLFITVIQFLATALRKEKKKDVHWKERSKTVYLQMTGYSTYKILSNLLKGY